MRWPRRPDDDKNEVGVGLNVEEKPQGFDLSTRQRNRQWPHAGGTAESDRRIVDHPPAVLIDLDRPPVFVTKIEIELAIKSADADEDNPFRRIEMGIGLDYV